MVLMPNLLTKLYEYAENLKGKNLYIALLVILVVFTVIGLVIGNVIGKNLNENEIEPTGKETQIPITENEQFEGKVVFVDPRLYPQDDISFYLANPEGKEIIMLKANDEKLTVVEGLDVVVLGKVTKSADGKKQILTVEKVVVKNK